MEPCDGGSIVVELRDVGRLADAPAGASSSGQSSRASKLN